MYIVYIDHRDLCGSTLLFDISSVNIFFFSIFSFYHAISIHLLAAIITRKYHLRIIVIDILHYIAVDVRVRSLLCLFQIRTDHDTSHV